MFVCFVRLFVWFFFCFYRNLSHLVSFVFHCWFFCMSFAIVMFGRRVCRFFSYKMYPMYGLYTECSCSMFKRIFRSMTIRYDAIYQIGRLAGGTYTAHHKYMQLLSCAQIIFLFRFPSFHYAESEQFFIAFGCHAHMHNQSLINTYIYTPHTADTW